MSNSKCAENVPPKQRVLQYSPGLLHCDETRLFCSICNVMIDHTRKASIDRHLQGIKHLARVPKRKLCSGGTDDCSSTPTAAKKQRTLFQTAVRAEKHDLSQELLDAWVSANIPIEKLDHPKIRTFIEKHVKNGGSVPTASRLRRENIDHLFERKRESLVERLSQVPSIALVVDEQSDCSDDYVLNIVAIPAVQESTEELQCYLLDSVYLEETNHQTVGKAVVLALTSHQIDFNKISAFVTDNAMYNYKCYDAILKSLLPNSVHITCNAHIFAVVANVYRNCFPLVDKFAANIKTLFLRSNRVKRRYKEYLGNRSLEHGLPPIPVPTRWNSWFGAVCYYAEHFQVLKDFLLLESSTSDNRAMQAITDLLAEQELSQEIEVAARIGKPFSDAILFFEQRAPLAHEVYDKVIQILH